MKLALFDLDNTLLNGDSDHAWGDYMAKVGLVNGDYHRAQNLKFFNDYKLGILNIDKYIAFQLSPLKQHPRTKILQHRTDFVANIINPLIRPKGLEALKYHRELGHTIIIITATNEFVTAPIAKLLGVDNLIATRVEEVNGEWTGQGLGVPSFGVGKITRLIEWLSARNINFEELESWFYSDSINDLPLLSRVTHPIIITPDDRLKAHAKQHNWEIHHHWALT